MNVLTLLLLLLWPADFSTFTFCRETDRGPFEYQCVALDPNGKGDFSFKPHGGEAASTPLELSPAAAATFRRLLSATNYLEKGDTYESGKRVANLGLKRLSIEGPMGRREATFNFSKRREAVELASFLEKLIGQERLGFDIEVTLKFERLAIPKYLDLLSKLFEANRFADPARLIPLLGRIQSDERLVNFARRRAAQLRTAIEQGLPD